MSVGTVFTNKYKLLYSNAFNTAMAGVTAYPASGYYVDVSAFERVHILVHFGSIHASDAPTLTLKCADAANGTLDVIDSTLVLSATASDDDKWGAITLEVRKLPTDHHFIALATGGTFSNGSYVDISIWGESLDVPVDQTSTLWLTNGELYWCG